jgi:hypothetical protein
MDPTTDRTLEIQLNAVEHFCPLWVVQDSRDDWHVAVRAREYEGA